MARDVDALQAVHDYRVLRRDQIQKLLFPSCNTANYRLQRLYQHGFLERRWCPVEYGQGSGRALYLMGNRGLQLLTQRLGNMPQATSYRIVRKTVRSPFLEHTLAVNDVRIAFSIAAQRERYGIQKWVREDDLKAAREYVYASTTTGTRRNVAIIPDAYFVLNLGDRRAHFLLEVDCATETSHRWAQRVRAYLAYVGSGQYARRFGTTSLRILMTTTNLTRLTHLKRATEQVGGQSLFWFATLEQASPEAILSERIWQVAGHEGMVGLIADSPGKERTSPLAVKPLKP